MKLQISFFTVLFLCTLLFWGCPGDDEMPPLPPPPVKDSFFIKGEMNSSPFDFVDGDGDQLVLPESFSKVTTDSCFQHYDVSGTYMNFDKEDSLVVSFIYAFKGGCPVDIDAFQALFKKGIIPFTTTTTPMDSGAVEINFKDLSDKKWSTQWGDQSGSIFEITESKAVLTIDLKDTRELKGTFNCTLYAETGEDIPVENGTFYIKLVPDL